jgi:hypothetical protein
VVPDVTDKSPSEPSPKGNATAWAENAGKSRKTSFTPEAKLTREPLFELAKTTSRVNVDVVARVP